MIKQYFKKIKNIFDNIDKKILKIMKNGLKFCFLILVISISMLITYLFFIHNNFIYQIGLIVFQLSLYFSADFIVSGLAIDTIRKQVM